jgi:hypothetical protein
LDANNADVLRNSVVIFELCQKRDRALFSWQELIKRQAPIRQLSKNPFLAALHKDPAYIKMVKPTTVKKSKPEERKQ